MSVKRYNQWEEDKIYGMDQNDCGEWVRYEDYEKLESEYKRLSQANSKTHYLPTMTGQDYNSAIEAWIKVAKGEIKSPSIEITVEDGSSIEFWGPEARICAMGLLCGLRTASIEPSKNERAQDRLVAGEFTITDRGNGSYWIQHESGEGTETSAETFHDLIREFFYREF